MMGFFDDLINNVDKKAMHNYCRALCKQGLSKNEAIIKTAEKYGKSEEEVRNSVGPMVDVFL